MRQRGSKRLRKRCGATGAPSDLRGLSAAMRRYHRTPGRGGSSRDAALTAPSATSATSSPGRAARRDAPEQVSRAVLERYQRCLYHYRKKDGAPLSRIEPARQAHAAAKASSSG